MAIQLGSTKRSVGHGGSTPLAPTKLTIRDGYVSGPEGRIPSAGLRVGGQRERVVGHPEDVDPLEDRLGDRVAAGRYTNPAAD